MNCKDDFIYESELSCGPYLVYAVKHTVEAIQRAYADIFPALQISGYQIDNKPILERYTDTMVNNHYCEICIPVKAL